MHSTLSPAGLSPIISPWLSLSCILGKAKEGSPNKAEVKLGQQAPLTSLQGARTPSMGQVILNPPCSS